MSIPAAGLIFFFGIYLFVEPYWINIKQEDFVSNELPDAFDSFKIVFISDIHHGPFLSQKRVHKVVQKVNNQKADIILLGGDYVHRDLKYIKPCFEELSDLKSNYGIYGVYGNHDHWESVSLTKLYMDSANITNINNSSFWLKIKNDSIKIGGVGDMWEDRQLIDSTISDVTQDNFVLLVSHNPDYAEVMETNKIDLMLSGHTHGGQVSLFGLWAPILPSKYGQKYRTGMVDAPTTKVLISNGIGTITPPVRFCTRPQINVLILKREINQ